jgi:UPF0716 protein FxsA
MFGVLVLLLIVVPIAELYVIVQVAHHIGLLDTLALLIVLSMTGGWLLKRQGMAAWVRVQDTLRAGHMPGREVVDGALILLGGVLLLTPGFITDAVGLLLLLPPARSLVKGITRKLLGRRAGRRVEVYSGGVYTTTARRRNDLNRSIDSTFPSDSRPELRVRGEDGSPDTE